LDLGDFGLRISSVDLGDFGLRISSADLGDLGFLFVDLGSYDLARALGTHTVPERYRVGPCRRYLARPGIHHSRAHVLRGFLLLTHQFLLPQLRQ
jgi:hypothetical protein